MTNGWPEYQKMVLRQLEQLDDDIKSLESQVIRLRIDVAQLKVKAGMWGAVAGMVPALITAIVAFSGQM